MSSAIVVGAGPTGSPPPCGSLSTASTSPSSKQPTTSAAAPERASSPCRACCTTTARRSTRWASDPPTSASSALERYGLRWRWPEIDCAHPLDSGEAGLLWRSVDDTASGSAPMANGGAGPSRGLADGLRRSRRRHHASHRPRSRAPDPACSASVRERCSPRPSRLAAGAPTRRGPCSAVSPLTPSSRSTVQPPPRSGRTIIAAGHRHGWPVAEGGSRSITDALAALLDELGGKIHTGVRWSGAPATSRPPTSCCSTSRPGRSPDIYGDRLPSRVLAAYRRYRHGPGAFKLDLAIEGHVPWTNPDCGRAGTVHLGGSFEEIAEHRTDDRERAGCPTVRSRSSASSTSPTRAGRRAASIPFGSTRTCPTATPETPPRRSCRRSSDSRQGSATASSPPQSARRCSSPPTTRTTSAGHHHRCQHPTAAARPTTGRPRSLQHRDPGHVHLLGGQPSGRGCPRHVWVQRRGLGPSPPSHRVARGAAR